MQNRGVSVRSGGFFREGLRTGYNNFCSRMVEREPGKSEPGKSEREPGKSEQASELQASGRRSEGPERA